MTETGIDFTWGGQRYKGITAFTDAMAVAWLTADGRNSDDEVRSFLRAFTDAEMARYVVEEWELAAHMAVNDYVPSDIAKAFGRLRAAQHFL